MRAIGFLACAPDLFVPDSLLQHVLCHAVAAAHLARFPAAGRRLRSYASTYVLS